jgi:FtsZ-interacting cell division protein ZipA
MITAILIILWEISLILSFLSGFWLGRKKKFVSKQKTAEVKNKSDTNRQIKESENFLSYDGTPQDVINDFE